MKVYENDEVMIDELYNIMQFIQKKHQTNDEAVDASYSLENAIIELRESLEI